MLKIKLLIEPAGSLPQLLKLNFRGVKVRTVGADCFRFNLRGNPNLQSEKILRWRFADACGLVSAERRSFCGAEGFQGL